MITASLLATAAVGGFGIAATAGSATTSATYSLTVAGTDAHTLDPHNQLIFAPGGGVQIVSEPGVTTETYRYIETGLNLPVGAKVTSIAITARTCHETPASTVFGYYVPSTRGAQQLVSLSTPVGCVSHTTTKTGQPIATVQAGRRYVMDFTPNAVGPYPGGSNFDAFFGATVKYTCTSPCVP